MNKQQLASKIWASANKMRSKIEANEYKDYILGFIFYKFLSDKEEKFAITEAMIPKKELPNYLKEDEEEMKEYFRDNLGYFISYDNLFSTWLDKKNDFDIADVRTALSAFERLIHPNHKKVFKDIFKTLETGIGKLGATSKDQTKAVGDLIKLIKDIPMDGRQDYDVLGFIYEYLISQFAANAGKKAGEFYTPHEVSLLMSEIVAEHLKDRKHIEIYDPTSGSGSLLINIGKMVSKHIKDSNSIVYYAQELKENTYNLTRMNLVMRGILPSNINVRNGDTLEKDWPFFEDEHPEDTYRFQSVDAVVSNPPYSQSWDSKNKENDPRFSGYGLAPKGKADYAFLLHDLYHLKGDGIMTIVLPHGVLFRGSPNDGSEGSIRKRLVEGNNIEAIIGLPANIFFGTGIPTLIMVLRKQRGDEGVLLIDASKGFVKEEKKNKLRASDIKRVLDVVKSRKDIPGFSRVVSKQTIRENDYNLNLPRYIKSTDEVEIWDIFATMFGGIPNSEIDSLQPYWSAFPNLREHLFKPIDDSYSQLACTDLESEIDQHPSIAQYKQQFGQAMDGFDRYLHKELLDSPENVNVNAEEETISEDIFRRLGNIPLVDAYEAYQLLDDKWTAIATDLEIIQTEGMDACHVVDPNMVIKKKDGKDTEVQDGWIGHVLPFELVQKTFLKEAYDALNEKENLLAQKSSEIEELVSELSSSEEGQKVLNDDNTAFASKELTAALDEIYSGVETNETNLLEVYCKLTKKSDKTDFIAAHDELDWSKMKANKDGTYAAKAVQARIKEIKAETTFPEDSVEDKLVRANALLAEEKTLKSECKNDKAALHLLTKETIEEHLSQEQVMEILRQKWILPVVDEIAQLPSNVIADFTAKLKTLVSKYETTMLETEQQIADTEKELSEMMSNLTGNDFDMKGLQQIQKLLNRK